MNKSIGFSFLWTGSTVPAVPCGDYAAEPKVNHHYGLESNLTFSRWQRPLTIMPYRIMTIVVAALVCVLAALFYRRFQYDRVKQLFSPSKAGSYAAGNGWYESESTQDSGFSRICQPLPKKRKSPIFLSVLPYGAWTFIYPYRNHIGEISRAAFTLGKRNWKQACTVSWFPKS